ncbi:hypothetical protein [Enterococcus sp. AZ102]|uniref:hypothetical protein n=1 Tax=Enterococcus sp. AZ102 TaxID=2774865 RepID=UPI003F221D9B
MNYEKAYNELKSLIASKQDGVFEVLNDFVSTLDESINESAQSEPEPPQVQPEPIEEVDAFQAALNKIK